MFKSFFPNPRLFFLSVVLWTIVCIALWYAGIDQLGAMIGLPNPAPDAPPVIGVTTFIQPDFVWFYIYFAVMTGIFYAAWAYFAPHPWQRWSVGGSVLILFVTYFQVQVSLAINGWNGPFGDMLQAAVSKSREVLPSEFYGRFVVFFSIAAVAVVVSSLNYFFVSHYVFRWRTAMSDFYLGHWQQLRHIEGASQRVQEDTMRFARITESLGVNLIDSVMTLIAFTPLLIKLSANVTELPLVGTIPYPLVFSAIVWSIFGTVLIAVSGLKLPGLEFRNQRTEAAFRKELVYGEDHAGRAEMSIMKDLFLNVRESYFRSYFHYIYFNIIRLTYANANTVFAWVVLGPSLMAGRISLGMLNQISGAFSQVTSSFQYLVSVWPTMIELLSIYKRLQAFEAQIEDKPLDSIEQEVASA